MVSQENGGGKKPNTDLQGCKTPLLQELHGSAITEPSIFVKVFDLQLYLNMVRIQAMGLFQTGFIIVYIAFYDLNSLRFNYRWASCLAVYGYTRFTPSHRDRHETIILTD